MPHRALAHDRCQLGCGTLAHRAKEARIGDEHRASIIHKQTGNLRAVQILLGHTKIESTVRYLGVDMEDALLLAEGTEV